MKRRGIAQFLFLMLMASFFVFGATSASAQESNSNTGQEKPAEPRKSNARPAAAAQASPTPQAKEPFDGATVSEMSDQCVTLQTGLGDIVIAVVPEAAPETVRNFLNLAATGAYDETTFSRVVPKFVVQGGNLATGQKWTLERSHRAARTVPDEPNYIKHVRGVVSLARPDEPNKGTTHFFILVGDSPHLDGTFAAFGRVVSGIEIADAINQAPVEGEKPVTPVVIKKALVAKCH
jgi:peptidyl-prolyl cis-trans isomerase B (cyclophilin B)